MPAGKMISGNAASPSGFALVGSVGAVVTGASGGNITTVAFGTGESRTAGNLLVLWVAGYGSATEPTTPLGWSIGKQRTDGTNFTCGHFYKIAAGADAAPQLSGIAGTVLIAQLAEFTGNAATPLDQVAGQSGTTSPRTATAASADASSGEGVIYSSAAAYSAPAAATLSQSFNNGVSAQSTNNGAASTVNHYDFGYGVTTGNAAADSDTYTVTTANLLGAGVAFASYKHL